MVLLDTETPGTSREILIGHYIDLKGLTLIGHCIDLKDLILIGHCINLKDLTRVRVPS